ncbi:DUF3108 domain-containing protein [bacterium]|nr:DUF3108 domain-containing protein [bacterium]
MQSYCYRPSILLMIVTTFSLSTYLQQSVQAATTPLSTLSDGNFERQLELPASQAIDSASPLLQEAKEAYAKLPFDVGERIRFVVTYLGVSGGSAEVIIHPPTKHQQTWAHRFTGEVKSARWYRWIMQIHDSIEALMFHGADMTPVRFYINQQEGTFRQSKIIEFDSDKSIIRQQVKRKDNPETHFEFPFVVGSKDALGALYYLRNRLAAQTPPPTHFEFPIFTSEKTWTGKADYLGSDTIKISRKKYETDVFRLVTTFGGLMEQKGDIKMWFSKDSSRLPLYIEASVRFGYIKVTLDEWDPGEAKKSAFEAIRHDL